MLRITAAAVVAAHGLIHLIGFVVPWGLAAVEGFPYRTAVLGGAVDLGDGGTRLLGLAWLACAVGFVIAGIAIWRRAAWALPITACLAVASIAICAMGLPEAGAGIAVDLAILGGAAWVALARRQPGSSVAEPVR